MTLLASVQIRSDGELCLVLVAMAVCATRKSDLVESFLPFRDVALLASQRRMLALQGIRSGRVLLHGEL